MSTHPPTPSTPSLIQDAGGYLFFSPNTKGQSGRAVKIHSRLFIDYLCAVDPDTHEGQTVIRDIESLKSFAGATNTPVIVKVKARSRPGDDTKGHQSRLDALNDRLAKVAQQHERTFVTKNVRVFYQIYQKEGDKAPTVYISEIQVLHVGRENIGGLYEYQRGMLGPAILSKSKTNNLEGKSVFISGATESAQDAMGNANAVISDAVPMLFFNPVSVADDLGIWKTPRLTDPTKKLIDELSVLIGANRPRKVAWYVEGEGAAVLAQALGKVSGSLESHSFRFINARANLPKLLQDLGQRKAQLQGEFIDHKQDRTALLAIASQSQDLKEQLCRLPIKPGYEQVTRRYLIQQLEALGNIGSVKTVFVKAAALRGSNTTFVETLVTVMRGLK